ncbi:hypothetical protein BGW38_003495 [Lunasporangiospora selenospora]|uniref:Uncharacterized protein n=1 Tax=Lunasporangiospora selenospora TaxID=979761 RepID=A0A9P6FR37_9FUNG|nr:hypothetical protein BGW38_003495 [Lunasporangiospora selenospora]
MGYRCDGLVQVVQGQPPLNIGVLEASKVFDNTGNKFLFDTCKVTRELHDMLRNRLKSLHVLTKSTELILVGYVLSGGYIVRIRPYHKQFKLAEDISHFKFNLRILKHLLVTKLVLLNTNVIMHEVPTNWDDDAEDDDAEDDTTGCNLSTPPRRIQLPPLQSSPTGIVQIPANYVQKHPQVQNNLNVALEAAVASTAADDSTLSGSRYYSSAFFMHAVALFPELRIRQGKKLYGRRACGNLDYVIEAKEDPSCMLAITMYEPSDCGTGVAQNVVQLDAISANRKRRRNEDYDEDNVAPIVSYGIATDSREWFLQ